MENTQLAALKGLVADVVELLEDKPNGAKMSVIRFHPNLFLEKGTKAALLPILGEALYKPFVNELRQAMAPKAKESEFPTAAHMSAMVSSVTAVQKAQPGGKIAPEHLRVAVQMSSACCALFWDIISPNVVAAGDEATWEETMLGLVATILEEKVDAAEKPVGPEAVAAALEEAGANVSKAEQTGPTAAVATPVTNAPAQVAPTTGNVTLDKIIGNIVARQKSMTSTEGDLAQIERILAGIRERQSADQAALLEDLVTLRESLADALSATPALAPPAETEVAM